MTKAKTVRRETRRGIRHEESERGAGTGLVRYRGYVVVRTSEGDWTVPALGERCYVALSSALARVEEHIQLARPARS